MRIVEKNPERLVLVEDSKLGIMIGATFVGLGAAGMLSLLAVVLSGTLTWDQPLGEGQAPVWAVAWFCLFFVGCGLLPIFLTTYHRRYVFDRSSNRFTSEIRHLAGRRRREYPFHEITGIKRGDGESPLRLLLRSGQNVALSDRLDLPSSEEDEAVRWVEHYLSPTQRREGA
jgi:hypothetical protein